MTIKAVIFDLDGTLLDSLADLARTANQTLESLGYPTHPLEAYKYFVGEGARTLLTRALPPQARTEPVIEASYQAFMQAYQQGWDQESKLYPGIAGMLDQLVHRALPLTILSNKPHPFTLQCAEKFLSSWPWQSVRGSHEHLPKKPDPGQAMAIAQDLGMAPEAFLYLGDTATDMLTANRAGMQAVGVLWGFRGQEELWQAGARHCLAHPSQLFDLPLWD